MTSDIRRRDGMVFYSIQSDIWNEIKVARIIPNSQSTWGAYLNIPDEWKRLIPEIEAESIDLAVNGHAKPLLESGLRPAKALIKRSKIEPVCMDKKDCLSYKEKTCTAYAKSRPPECYSSENVTGELAKILNAWLDGFTVVKEKGH